jgi:hypothetical protein
MSRGSIDILPHSLMCEEGYAARLCNLEGSLAIYNGKMTHPKQLNEGIYSVTMPKIIDDIGGVTNAAELVLPARHFDVVVDLEALVKAKFLTSKMRRGSVAAAEAVVVDSEGGVHLQVGGKGMDGGTGLAATLETLTMKLRARARTGEDIRQTLKIFDADNSGHLDRNEFRIGCHALDINISTEQIDLLWPIFDHDNSNSVSIDEFLEVEAC